MTGARELLTKRSPRATFDSLSKLPAGHRRLTADENSRMTGFDKLISFLKSRVSKERRRAFRRYFVFHFRGIQSLACRLVFGSNLRAIAHYYGTDKWGEHRYAEHYETLFAPLRRKKLALLEIGIGGYESPDKGGASLRMWRAFFPRGLIVGVDIHDKKPHDEARIKTFKGSQSDQVFLERVVSEIGRPDIIIDDGSHEYKDIVASYNFLFPKLKPGGYYAIEDTFFAYAPDFCGSDPDPDSPLATVGYFKQLVHRLNHRERVDSRQTSNYGELIVAVCFYNNLVVIKKGDDEATPDVDAFFYEDGARTFENHETTGPALQSHNT